MMIYCNYRVGFEKDRLKMELKRLESAVIEKIRSSFSINTVSQCVTELVLNSLDAKSTAIAVRLNLVTFKIQVVDNGEGITQENMRLLGFRYFTNKCKNLEDLGKSINHYGFRGEALASIMEFSKMVNITSRHQNSSNTYSRTLGKYSSGEVSQVKPRPSVGTTVTIEGFFHSLPVRRKRVISELELEEIKRVIEGLIILHSGVTFSVRNDVNCELILNSQKSDDLITSFKNLHPDLGDDFSLMKVSKNKVMINALFYKTLTENKNLQYISVNKRPIFSLKIQKLVGSLFKKNQKVDRKNPICALKKYPVFVMNIKCPISKVDILLNPTKTMVVFENWDLIQRCICKLVYSFFGKGTDLKKKETFLTEELKRDCGVSQIIGACRRFGYKRKNADDSDDNIVQTETAGNAHKMNTPHLENNGENLFEKQIRDNPNKNPTVEVHEDEGERFCISEAPTFEKNFRNKNKFKKPLPITVGNIKVTKNNVDNGLPDKQDDMKSSISEFTDDQNKGKNLIMDMFLKSTQIYSSDENLDKLSGCSQETIFEEESNFQFENNYQTKFKGMSNTMSISVNVKSKRKIRKRKSDYSSKYVQTELLGDKIISRAVQTSTINKSKKKRRVNVLKESRSVEHSRNVTVVLSDSGEKAHFKLNKKNTGGSDETLNSKFEVSSNCHCKCHMGEKKIFNFHELTNEPHENICILDNGSIQDQLLKNYKRERYDRDNRYDPKRKYFDNRNFIVERKNVVCQDYERSPYFASKKYSEENVEYNQYPYYPIQDSNAYSNKRYRVQLKRNFFMHQPSLPPYYIRQNDAELFDIKRPNHLRQNALNNCKDWTIDEFGQFRPAHVSTQKNEKDDWKNSSFKDFQPSHPVIRDWTINSFGQFKPVLCSTQKNTENYVAGQIEMLFTPSPVKYNNSPLDSLLSFLNNSHELHNETKKNNDDNQQGPNERMDENMSMNNPKPNAIKEQDILDKEMEAEKSFLAREFLNWESQFTQDIGNDWLKKFNKCGNSYYVNKKTGFTTFQTPKVENQFKYGKRFYFMPKGMSPILTETKQIDKSLSQHSKDMLLEYIMESYKNELLYIKWQHFLNDVDPDTFFKNIYKEKLKIFEACIPDISTKNKPLDNVISFSKDLFENIEVIGQLDKKFIIVLEKKLNLLIIFDQHAVHERIRLEDLLKSAIKFGDKLTKNKCRELLMQLSSCNFPFQCAHGRPTLAPLVELEVNEDIVNCKPTFQNLNQI